MAKIITGESHLNEIKDEYSIEKDRTLWELHEIRREIHKEMSSQNINEINKASKELFRAWKNRTSNSIN